MNDKSCYNCEIGPVCALWLSICEGAIRNTANYNFDKMTGQFFTDLSDLIARPCDYFIPVKSKEVQKG